MRSPVSSQKQMKRIDLEKGLSAYQCAESGGVFLPIASYFQWLSRQPGRLPHLPSSDGQREELINDTKAVKICPESGQIMQRYQVGNKFAFSLDRSPSGSIWFDKGEWEKLKSRQFHDELHLIFTAQWQAKVRKDEVASIEQNLLVSKLGEEFLSEIDSIKGKLAGHPHRDLAMAYLQR